MRALGYDSASWADIWASAVAVEEMCIKQGKIGYGIGLGKSMRHFDSGDSSRFSISLRWHFFSHRYYVLS